MSIWQNNFGAPFSFKNVLGVNTSIPASMPGPVPASMPKQETKPPMNVPQNTPANGNASTPAPKQNAPTMKPWSGVLKPEPMKFTSPADVFKSPTNSFLKTNQPQQAQPQQAQQPAKIEPKKPTHNINEINALFGDSKYYDVRKNATTNTRFEYNPETKNFSIVSRNPVNNITTTQEIVDSLTSLEIQKENEYINAKKRNPYEAERIQEELNGIKKLKETQNIHIQNLKQEQIDIENKRKQDEETRKWWEQRRKDDARAEELNKIMKELGTDFDPDNNPEHKAMYQEFYQKVGNYNGKDKNLYAMRREDMIEGPKEDFTKEINQEAQTANLDNGISDNPAGTENSEASKQNIVADMNENELKDFMKSWIYDIDPNSEEWKKQLEKYKKSLMASTSQDPDIIAEKEKYKKLMPQSEDNQNQQSNSQTQEQQDTEKRTRKSLLDNQIVLENKAELDKMIFDIRDSKRKGEDVFDKYYELMNKINSLWLEDNVKQNLVNQAQNIFKGSQKALWDEEVGKTSKQIAQEKVAILNQNKELNDGVYEQNKQKLDGFRSQGYNVDQSVVDSLSARGLHNSYDIRKKMYEKMTGQSDFRGTAEQNIYLKNMAERLTEEDIEAILFDEDEIAVMD